MYFGFKNYDEFKQIFGLRECGNGNKSRMNKILLGCLKNRKFFHYCVEYGLLKYLHCTNMADFKRYLLEDISDSSCAAKGYGCGFVIDGRTYYFRAENMEIDNNGFCEDGDHNAIRYYNTESERYFKMKAGKFFTKIMEGCEFGSILPQQAKSWLGEEFLTSWQAFTEANMPSSVVGFHYGDELDDFKRIYSSHDTRGNFHSCMEDNDNYSMYHDACKCHAAWLTDAEGMMFARCIIFDEVCDETTGETLRLAERQYSDGVQDRFKKMLVDELIKRELIDGYKQIGADCHDNRNFVLVDGTSIRDHELSIACSLEEGDTVSYMDSFVYYDRSSHIAYNYESENYTDELDVTGGELEESHNHEEWSSYNEEWIPEDDAYYVERHEDYFYEDQVVVDRHGDYQLIDDCEQCAECGDYMLREDMCQEDGLPDDLWFCNSDCAQNWAYDHGYVWADYEECYLHEDDAVSVKRYDYGYWDSEVISTENFEYYHDDMRELDGEWYWLENEKAEEAYKKMTLPTLVVA